MVAKVPQKARKQESESFLCCCLTFGSFFWNAWNAFCRRLVVRQDLHSHSIVIRNNRVFFPALFSRCLACLRNEAIITFSESDLSFACAEMAEWLEVAAPENMEQRLCALFLAVRLAQHVGLFAEIWCDVNGFVFHFGLCFHVLNKWMISCAECHSAFPPRRSNKSRSDES